MLRDCAKRGTPFVDPSFPPLDRSLYLNGKGWAASSNQHRAATLGPITWRRAADLVWRAGPEEPWRPDFRPLDLEVFRGTPLPTDVLQ